MADDACDRRKARAEALRYEPGDNNKDELTGGGAYARFVATEPAPQWPVSTRYVLDYTVPVMGVADVPCECSICAGARRELMDYVRALRA
jgi:hypothetical protein